MIAFIMSELGRKIMLAGALALAALVFVLKVFNAGKHAAYVEGLQEKVTNAATRAKVDDVVSGANDTERDRLRNKWTRP